MFVLNFVIFIFLYEFVSCQECIQEPDGLEWTDIGDNTLSATLEMTTCFVNSAPNVIHSFWTRCFGGSIPGPTLRMRRGRQYQLTLRNTLGPENAINNQLGENIIRNSNHTNIHTHGLHISGEVGGDYVFEDIAPGEERTYLYYIPCDHAGGTFWYHPHVHGSTALQAGGGALGLLIIEEDPIVEGLPSWISNMREILLGIYFIDLVELRDLFSTANNNDGAENLFSNLDESLNLLTNFHLVNGEYQPTICVNANEWTRFRISYAQISNPMAIFIPGCELQLLAKDGVWIYGGVPRQVSHLFFTQGSRVDVAVYCPASNTRYEITANNNLRLTNNDIIGFISVQGTGTRPSLTTFEPIRPDYLRDLTDINSNEVDFRQTVIVGRNDIMGVRFAGVNNLLFQISINDIVEFNIESDITRADHPFHLHVNHFQLISGGSGLQGNLIPNNWNVAGDYLDVVMTSSTIRWYADTYGGRVNMHCHILEHEDEGAMGVFYINGGCDARDNNIDNSSPCVVRRCNNNSGEDTETDNPTVVPTVNPTTSTTTGGINIPSPTQVPTGSINIPSPTQVPTITPQVSTQSISEPTRRQRGAKGRP